MATTRVDATSHAPKTSLDITLHGERYNRKWLETAWLLLEEHGGDPINTARALYDLGWHAGQAVRLVKAAKMWTGNVVAGDAR